LINYQIVENAPQIEINPNGIEKNEMSQEIEAIRQVINDLKVEKLKYQTYQS
jgi:hypothetical protein